MAYKAMNSLNPKVGQKMRMEVIDTLLEKVYISSDNCVHKSRILIAKGGELRASGVEKLEECIEHLSEAISILVNPAQTSFIFFPFSPSVNNLVACLLSFFFLFPLNTKLTWKI